ncbi:MAG: non-canonical purine NTP pyrophosphatase [Monoglobus pectinilyticus]
MTKKRAGTNGFGYDPIFYYPEKQCTLSELGSNEKNKISHRYKALKKFAESI